MGGAAVCRYLAPIVLYSQHSPTFGISMKFLVFACFCQKWVDAGSKGLWELGNGIPQPNPFTVEAGRNKILTV